MEDLSDCRGCGNPKERGLESYYYCKACSVKKGVAKGVVVPKNAKYAVGVPSILGFTKVVAPAFNVPEPTGLK